MVRNRFERSGIAALSDLDSDEWRPVYAALEREQSEFLSHESRFRSPEYFWPRDALHNWSRIWEYPYAYYHLRSLRGRFPQSPAPRVVDLGSGVTFFPFAVAKLGYRVTCVDNDPVCEKDIPLAANALGLSGIVDCRMASAEALPFSDREVDIVYCISVLEHVRTFEPVIEEVARILRPGGALIVTFDVDLRGGSEIGPERYRHLKKLIDDRFALSAPVETAHPIDMLRTDNAPYGFPRLTPAGKVLRFAKSCARMVLKGKPFLYPPYLLAVEGATYEKMKT
jgi:SAM-dependent methyltransferase